MGWARRPAKPQQAGDWLGPKGKLGPAKPWRATWPNQAGHPGRPMASSSATSWGVLGREGPLRRDPLAGVVLRLGSGSQGEQGVLNGRLPPLGPPMGALVPLQPGGRNHGAPDAANAFAALVSGEIGAGGALAEQTDHQSLRESEERRFAWPAAWAASVKLHRRTPSGGAGQRGGVCNGGSWLGLVAGGWIMVARPEAAAAPN